MNSSYGVTDSSDEVDFVMIDIRSQWDLIGAALRLLRAEVNSQQYALPSTAYKNSLYLEEKGFTSIEAEEILVRKILVQRGKPGLNNAYLRTGW